MQIAAPPLESQTLEKLREQELEEARAIQSGMLPAESLRTDQATICHEFQPVETVGGDFLDYFTLSDGTLGLYLGDVSGKGLGAAMYAALAVGTLRGVHKTGQSPGPVFELLNKRLLLRGVPRRHAAIQYAMVDPQNGAMQITSAGMPGPVHLSQKCCRPLRLSGIPPGLLAEAKYETSTVQLQPGDSVLFCTDGVTDAFNTAQEIFGMERLMALCEKHREASPNELLEQIFSALERFRDGREQHDDITAAILHYRG
jgi:phosphoserine phosphatase RsbU/P